MPSRSRKLHWLLVPAFGAGLVALSLLGVEARYSAPALAALGALHLLLAATLHLALVAGRLLGTAAGFLAAVGVSLVLLWHCRELTYRPQSLAVLVVASLALALPIHLVMRAAEPRLSLPAALAALAGAALATGVAVAAAYQVNELRWHLLRHNKMLGTPAYYLLSTGVEEVEGRLFDRHRSNGDPGKDCVPADIQERVEERSRTADAEPDVDTPPHLIFVLLDTLRADALAMGGGPRDAMPRLNAFVDRAWGFTDVIANASWTRPSMASMVTGLLPEEHGARDVDDPLEDDFTTLAEVLGGHGWETAAFVSNVGAVGRGAGFAQGFDSFYELEGRPYARAGRIRAVLAEWLSRRAGAAGGASRPLFAYLHFLDPHDPYLAGRVPASKSRDEYAAAYRAELAYLDGELGRIFELLDERLPGPKAVLVASDHGEQFGEHEEFGHGYSLYREVLAIPLAFADGRGAGELGAPLEGRDVFDLVTRWAAAGGRLEVAAWAAARGRERRYASIYYSSAGRLALRPYLRQVAMRSLETEGHKLIWSAYGPTFELYDTGADRREQRNLAAARPDLVARYEALFDPSVKCWNFPDPYERSSEELEQLRALGYLGD